MRKRFSNESAQPLCDEFNNTFLNAAVKLREENSDKHRQYEPKCTCANSAYISEQELWNIISTVKLWKPAGYAEFIFAIFTTALMT